MPSETLATFEDKAGRFIWIFLGGMGLLLGLTAFGVLGVYWFTVPETDPIQVAGLAGLGCLMPVITLGCTLPVVGFMMFLGRTRLGIGPLKQFAQEQRLDIVYPTLFSPARSPTVVLPDGSAVRAAAGQPFGPQLIFLMPVDGPSRFHLGPGGQVVRALRRAVMGDADVVALDGTRLGDGWRCLSREKERARAFVEDNVDSLEMLLTEAGGTKGVIEFTAGDWPVKVPAMLVILPASYGMPDNLVGVTLDRMRSLRERWESAGQP